MSDETKQEAKSNETDSGTSSNQPGDASRVNPGENDVAGSAAAASPASAEESRAGGADPASDPPAQTAEEEAARLTPEELGALTAKASKADEYWERLLRVSADMENFKKRAVRERQEAVRYGNEGLLSKLLPVMDHFEMALQAAASQPEAATMESLKAGITMVYNQLRSVLGEAGLEEIDAAGQPFDPSKHEAVSQMESADQPEGQVLQQLRRGYRLHERLIRPASVIVSKKPASS